MKPKICKDCPFRHDNIGKEQVYSSEIIRSIIQREENFICHNSLDEDNNVIGDVESSICRGYVASVRKGCKLFKYNKLLIAAREQVTDEDIVDVFPYFKYGRVHKC